MKAADPRQLLKAVAVAAERHCVEGNAMHVRRAAACRTFCRLCEVLVADSHLPKNRVLLQPTYLEFLAHYHWLAKHAVKEGHHLWSLVPKQHF